MTTTVTWHHEVGLPVGMENKIRTRVQHDLDKVTGAEKIELVGYLFDLYSPPHRYWTRREEFGEGTGEFTLKQQEYFKEREKVFGREGRVPILGSLVLRTYELDKLYDLRLAGRGETTFRIWTEWPQRISIKSSPPEQFTHVNQDVIGRHGRLLSVSGSLDEVIPYIERTVGKNKAYCAVPLSGAVTLYLNRVTQDGATSEVLPLFRNA
ncbi:MAG: hypothetical protein AABX34_00845 [Nanoarchaeota archaeon]